MAVTIPKGTTGKGAPPKATPTTATSTTSSQNPTAATHGHGDNDVADMVKEIGIAVVAGSLPFVAQGINIYDTVDCLLTLRNSKDATARAEAKFDLVLAIVGWIPGAGGGVKKTMRIVNKNPDRYAPIMFDVLRMVLSKLGIQTSPEVLLAELFDAAALQRVLVTVQLAIEESWLYEEMPRGAQMALSSSMAVVRAELPAMVRLVANKLMHWKTKQRNNAARPTVAEKKTPALEKPAKKDVGTATKGQQTPGKAHNNGVSNFQLGAADLAKFTKKITGILGEHITDYFLVETYEWGGEWDKHDMGDAGSWKLRPNGVNPGKLNDDTKLNKLFPSSARGTGIDGAWRVHVKADNHNRKMKYAIVESKASVVCDAFEGQGKPNIGPKLGHNKRNPKPKNEPPKTIAEAIVPTAEELLEPDTCDLSLGKPTAPPEEKASNKSEQPKTESPKVDLSKTAAAQPPTAKKRKRPYKRNRPPPVKKQRKVKVHRVQMSRAWIRHNLDKSVGVALSNDIAATGYSRHLFYTPFYLESALQHAEAILKGDENNHGAHLDHTIPLNHRYDDEDIRVAVNHKHELLGIKIVEV
jgi:hypothetical protein